MNELDIERIRQDAKMSMLKDGNLMPLVYLEKRDGIIFHFELHNNFETVVLMLKSGTYKSYLHVYKKEYKVNYIKKQAISIVYKDEFGQGFDEIIPFIQTQTKVYFDVPVHRKTNTKFVE